ADATPTEFPHAPTAAKKDQPPLATRAAALDTQSATATTNITVGYHIHSGSSALLHKRLQIPGSDHYQIGSSVAQLQTEIMNHGPIECAFTVYENFMHYQTGVYDHHEGRELGGHAVTNYGWGVQGGTPYWIFHNSWNVTWGNQG
ncbi:MAG: hypothetical protein GY696_27705, partial [Gammaproteobacteria bacterium]|nr:hypothetical protein [Gammaproteobacteria bacterium]